MTKVKLELNYNNNSLASYNWITRPIYSISYFLLIIFSYFFVDRALALFIKAHETPFLTSTAKFITYFGEAELYLFLFGFLFLFYRYKLKRVQFAKRWLYLLVTVISSGLICDLIKYLLARARPVELFTHKIYGFHFFHNVSIYPWSPHITTWFSFPSGHSTTAAAVSMGVSLLWPRYAKNAFIFAMLIALSRLMLTRHYLSDVMAGLYLGVLVALYLFKYFKSKFFSVHTPRTIKMGS